MNRRLPAAIALSALAAASLTACSSGPSRPSWCQPLATPVHVSATEDTYQAGLAAFEKQGAPVGKYAADLARYEHDKAVANSATAASYTALPAEAKDLKAMAADLKQLSAKCGQS